MNNDFTPIFVVGVARSGSTLNSRIIASSGKTAAAVVDSLETLFKVWRLLICKNIGIDIDLHSPFFDYYFSDSRIKIAEAIDNSDITCIDCSRYIDIIADDFVEFSESYSPLKLPKTFFDGKKTIFDVLSGFDAFTSPLCPYFVIKENYIIDFMRPLKRAFPNAKFIFPYRDPRALIASRIQGGIKFGVTDNIHLMSRLRAWRQHLAFAFDFVEKYPSDSVMVQYEELVINQADTIKKICDIIEIPFEDSLLGENGFSSGDNLWNNNTSFGTTTNGIFNTSLEKWRNLLSNEMVMAIEYLCYHEMKLLGYDIEYLTQFPVSGEQAEKILLHDKNIDDAQVWITTEKSFDEEVACEQMRHECIHKKILPSDDWRKLFLTSKMASLLLSI